MNGTIAQSVTIDVGGMPMLSSTRDMWRYLLTHLPALSFRQPWAHGVVIGGKDVENRLQWKGSNFRGPFLIHASSGMTRHEYEEVVRFVEASAASAVERSVERQIDWRPPPMDELQFGGIIGRGRVVDVILPGGRQHPGLVMVGKAKKRADIPASQATMFPHPKKGSPWYMGGFALVLDEVEPLPFLPCKGARGWFSPLTADPSLRKLVGVAPPAELVEAMP